MGKGDIRTRRGKIWRGTYGVTRPRRWKTTMPAPIAKTRKVKALKDLPKAVDAELLKKMAVEAVKPHVIETKAQVEVQKPVAVEIHTPVAVETARVIETPKVEIPVVETTSDHSETKTVVKKAKTPVKKASKPTAKTKKAPAAKKAAVKKASRKKKK